MKHSLFGLFVAILLPLPAWTSPAVDSSAARGQFPRPAREFTSGPLWVWNDLLTGDQVRGTLRDLAGQGVRQAWVHPRPGLMTPYLSDDWFRLWKIALREAERLDMNIWIYDENSYPSGFAGGWVPELMPESRGRGLHFRETKTCPAWATNTLAVFRLADGSAVDVSDRVRGGESLPEARYLVAQVQRAANSPWTGGRSYVDLMYPGVTAKFIEVTFEAYRREIGKHFGKRVPGIFTDEPELTPAGGLPWTPDLPEQFAKRWEGDLVASLASLTREVGDWRRVRYAYYQTLLDLFIERWAMPCFTYCAQNDLEFTGHYWEHGWPGAALGPDNMAMAAWQQRPGIDILMNQYAEHTHAQFGNVRAGREISSIANQLGRRRTLVEVYGAGGWDLRFEDMKRIGDWLEVLGVNTLNEHLSYVTIRGARKRDHPQSFSYHTPWWEGYHTVADYFSRVTVALTQGEQVNRVLVLEPTTTAWMYQGHSALGEIGSRFFRLLMALESAQIEYDLGSEDVMARFSAAVRTLDNGRPALEIGRRAYDIVVLPPRMENLNSLTAAVLEDYVRAGGRLVLAGSPPQRINGELSSDIEPFVAEHAGDQGPILLLPAEGPDPEAKVVEVLRGLTADDPFRLEREPGDAGILFHHRRQLRDGQILFLVNTSIQNPSAGTVQLPAGNVESWNPHTGKIEPAAFERSGDIARLRFNLPPCGSRLLFFASRAAAAAGPGTETETETVLEPTGPTTCQRLEPNVVTLDYVDVTAGGETRARQYFYAAQQWVFQKNGMDRNPWDSAVQFRDELIRKTFPPESGFEASYRFTIEGSVPRDLEIVLERPDLYTITCNGTPVKPTRKAWWLDRAFGRIPLAGAARVGENIVTLRAAPFTIYHELEPAYVRGSFRARPAASGFVLAPDEPLRLERQRQEPAHAHNPEGSMWLSGGVGFGPDSQGQAVEDRAPFVVFDLGKPTDLSAVRIWNYNENHVRDLTSRGVRELRISASTVAATAGLDLGLGTATLAKANGAEATAETVRAEARAVRYVRFDILANHAGVRYPATGDVPDHGFAGLAEVQFVAADGAPVRGVRVAGRSSELAAHSRQAQFLVDGSGLVPGRLGWNRQGHPFYAEGVAYRQSYRLAKPAGRYQVALPDWLGSTAKVVVNGKTAGYIGWAPWELDVTPWLRKGENQVEVVVIGTLKNTLGPHHGNPQLGTAWPAMFHQGPNPGPPPGQQYHTVGYGLFEPFTLVEIR